NDNNLMGVYLPFQSGFLVLTCQLNTATDDIADRLYVLRGDGAYLIPIAREIWMVLQCKIWPEDTDEFQEIEIPSGRPVFRGKLKQAAPQFRTFRHGPVANDFRAEVDVVALVAIRKLQNPKPGCEEGRFLRVSFGAVRRFSQTFEDLPLCRILEPGSEAIRGRARRLFLQFLPLVQCRLADGRDNQAHYI